MFKKISKYLKQNLQKKTLQIKNRETNFDFNQTTKIR